MATKKAPPKPAAKRRANQAAVAETVPVVEDARPLSRGKSRAIAAALSATAPGMPGAPSASAAKAPSASLKAQMLALLKESLDLRVEDGDFTDPNRRTVKVLFDGKEVSRASFDVRSRREYEG